MNFEEYAQQMCKKYKLAVSVAIIQNKPDHISVEQYLEQLKEKAEFRTETVDPCLISSGDFDIDDDNFSVDHDLFVNEFNTICTSDKDLVVKTKFHNIESKESKITLAEINESASVDFQNHAISLEENARNNEEMLKEFEIKILSNANVDDDSLEDVLQTLRGIDEDKTSSQAQQFYPNSYEISQIIPGNSFNNFKGQNFEYNITICDELANDSIDVINLPSNNNTPVTINEELRAKVEKNVIKIMKSAEDITIDKSVRNENIYGETDIFKNTYEMEVDVALNEIREATTEQKCNSISNLARENITTIKKNISNEYSNPSTQFCKSKEKIPTNITDFKNTYELEVDIALKEIHGSDQQYELKADSAIDKSNHSTLEACPEILKKCKITANVNEEHNLRSIHIPENSTQDTILYTIPDVTQHASYISQSQYQTIEIPQKLMYKLGENAISNDNANNGPEYNSSGTNNDKKNNYENPTILTIDSNSIQYVLDQSGKTYAVLNSMHLNKTVAKFKADGDTKKETKLLFQNKGDNLSQEMNDENIVSKRSQETGPNTQLDFPNNENVMEKEMDMEDDLDEESESEEVVPFKVVKELSKVKAYLSRRDQCGSLDGNLSDSGYRSDSQSSFKSGKARARAGECARQAGQCLWEYLARCPLRPASAHIDAEIAQVLGGLVDRLHEEEKQPEFVEQLLEGVGALLRGLGEGGGDTILDKDEAVERLVLLNQSAHVLDYSLQRTITMLEGIHARFTSQQSPPELADIAQAENSRHIFHILEIFIQMYDKNKVVTSEGAAQTSQDTKVLKRSSLTEIWRRKWNPSEAQSASSQAGAGAGAASGAGVRARCGAALNRLVVDCMDGYGLVSFAALHCFNMLHT